MEKQYSFKDLEEVIIKTTSNIEMNERTIEAGETMAVFDKIQLAHFSERKNFVTAHGGYYDLDRVWWETEKGVSLNFEQGIFSSQELALLINSHLMEFSDITPIYINFRECLESSEDGGILLSGEPYDHFFVYEKTSGDKIKNFIRIGKNVSGLKPYTDYIFDYNKKYESSGRILTLGSQLTNGFLTLQGKTRVKDDVTGIVRTGIITIPKLKLMSGLSMRLGTRAEPVVESLQAMALPVGSRGHMRAIEIAILDDYIDSDM